MLHRLAAERATGVLLREHGTLYLSEGRIVHAESPETPGLDVLLTTGGLLHPDAWREAVAQAGARRRVGRYLVDHGRISEGSLELCHVAAVFDAAYFVLGASGEPARFRYGAVHWLGAVRPVPVAALERETLRRRELLHRIWPDPATDSAPLARAELPAGPPVTARQGAVLDQVDGVRTAADISHVLGRPAFHTLVDLRRLVAAGIVRAAPPRAAEPEDPSHGPPAPDPHHPQQSGAIVDPVSALLAQPAADPGIALLRRLRDALEAL
ncbi:MULTISPECIES: transcriptional regulator [Streptomyces]|nr:transcriptional regulator [Streptomyces ruber]